VYEELASAAAITRISVISAALPVGLEIRIESAAEPEPSAIRNCMSFQGRIVGVSCRRFAQWPFGPISPALRLSVHEIKLTSLIPLRSGLGKEMGKVGKNGGP
jgi:hypothetical protein